VKKNFIDYIGDSFKILFHNKILLFPGVVDTLYGGFLLLISYNLAINVHRGGMFSTLLLLLLTGMGAAFLIAGKLNMIRLVYEKEHDGEEDGEIESPQVSDYFEGAKDFGLKIFGGSLLIMVGALIFFIPLLMISVMMQVFILVMIVTIGFVVLMLFITLWDTILVADDTPITDAIGDSISFVKGNFLVVLGLNLFAGIISFEDVLSPNIDIGAQNYGQGPLFELPMVYQWFANTMGPLSWPLILVVAMVFNVIAHMVFMDLYLDRRNRYGSFS